MTFGKQAPSSHQFSVMEVTDTGTEISFKAVGYAYDEATGKVQKIEGAQLEMAAPFVKSALSLSPSLPLSRSLSLSLSRCVCVCVCV
eukprot:COSAG03_NODE_6180_length_1101_cov_1.497006_1_plen_87_part_00